MNIVIYMILFSLMATHSEYAAQTSVNHTVSAQSQQHTITKTRAISSFDCIVIEKNNALPVDIKLIIVPAQAQEKLVLAGDNAVIDFFLTEVKDNILYIKPRREKSILDSITNFFKSSDTKSSTSLTITVGLAHQSLLIIDGDADVTINDIIGDNFILAATGEINITASASVKNKFIVDKRGSGHTTLKVYADDFSVDSSGTGTFDIQGNVQYQDAHISGSGTYNAADLCSSDTDIVLHGTVQTELYATTTLNITTSGSSHITHRGNTKSVESVVNGAATIKKI